MVTVVPDGPADGEITQPSAREVPKKKRGENEDYSIFHKNGSRTK